MRSQSKLKVTQGDYKKWHTLTGETISPDGMWVSYKFQYENNIDTAFVIETATSKKLSFAGANDLTFSPDSKNVVVAFPGNNLLIQTLNNKSFKKFDSISRYEFSKTGKFMAILRREENKKQLLLLNQKSEVLGEFKNVADFKISDDGKLAVANASGLKIFDTFDKYKGKSVITDTTSVYKKLVWDNNGETLAFFQENRKGAAGSANGIYCYNTISGKLKYLPVEKLNGLSLNNQMQTPLIFSSDGQTVFFYYTSKPTLAKDEIVQVWDSSAKLVYPAEKRYGDTALIPKIAVWDIKSDTVKLLATDEFPLSVLTSDKKYALTYSYLTNEPQYEMVAPVDIYITEAMTGIRNLLLAKQSMSPYSISSSPSGRYINYFKDRHWWIYDIETARHLNLTSNLDVSFADEDFDFAGPVEEYMCPGWTSDSKYLILYDKYDIWLMSPDGNTKRRITKGREEKISYRIYLDYYRLKKDMGSADLFSFSFDIRKGLLLNADGYDKATGFFKWTYDGNLQKIAYGNSKFSGLRKADDIGSYIYIEETFEVPPALNFVKAKSVVSKKLVQSNSFYKKYEWGASKVVSYKNSRGEDSQAALYYPAGFDPTKKYPMIVFIYSLLSQEVHDYRNPTMYHGIGFAPTNYTSDGYLILMPDIKYVVGAPGKSIEDCVMPAITAVTQMGIVEKDHIGLIGHSYGGYQTCHLLTRTSIFAAAVAGAPMTDMISSYFTVNPDNGRKNDWRFESQQFRMASTPFDNLAGYLANSTVTNANKITTPLLHWSGTADQSVDWRQGIELHSALRRLQKKNIFLVYPGQGHVLSDQSMRLDLTIRIKSWFDHYLKEKPYAAVQSIPATANGI
jgi:dipeptidyl aminopeptidase/acylaminoacyl peptidase